jgi:hypothetical protein
MDTGSNDRHSGEPIRLLVELDEEDCKALLGTGTIGRLAVATEEGPEMFPVNYGYLDGAIAIWSDRGRKLEHASFDRVAFLVDDLDLENRTGWVVEAMGHAEDITDAVDPWAVRLRALEVHPWVSGPHPYCIAILRPRLSGRRLVPAPQE